VNHLEPTELGNGKASETYGSGIAADEDKFTLLKLLMLDPEELCDPDHPQGYKVIQQAVEKTNTRYTGIDAVAEYIKRLWADGSQGVREYLEQVGQLQPKDVETLFVFGVPAVWKPRATENVRVAIARSGILAFGRRLAANLMFIDEPVAAALAVIPDMVRRGSVQVCVPFFPLSSFSRTRWRVRPFSGSAKRRLTCLPGRKHDPHPRLRRRYCCKSIFLSLCRFTLCGRSILRYS
jgi:hypothetical protein